MHASAVAQPLAFIHCVSKNAHFLYDCSFHKCWPIFLIIFGKQYTELMGNITIIYLSNWPTYCCYTPWETLDVARKVWQRKVTRGCTKTYALSLSGCTSLIFINPGTKILLLLLTQCTYAADGAVYSFHCWWRLRIPAWQWPVNCARYAVELLQGETLKFMLQTYGLQTVLTLTP